MNEDKALERLMAGRVEVIVDIGDGRKFKTRMTKIKFAMAEITTRSGTLEVPLAQVEIDPDFDVKSVLESLIQNIPSVDSVLSAEEKAKGLA